MEKVIRVRNSYWDNIKFFLIILVVIGHFIDCLTGSSRSAQAIYVFLYSFHMPMFLFVSRLFLRYDDHHKLRIDKIIYYIFIGYAMKFGLYLMEAIAGGTPEWSWLTTSNAPWYMFVTAGYMLVVYIVRNVSPKIIFPVAFIISFSAGYFDFIGDFLCLSKFIVFFPFFYAGYCLTPQKVRDFISKKSVKIIGITTAVIFGAFCICFTDIAYKLRPVFAARYSYTSMGFSQIGVLLRLLQYVLAALIILGVCAIVTEKRIRFFTDSGTRTLPVYFIHYFVARVCNAFDVQVLLIENYSYFGFFLIILIAVTVAFALALKPFNIPFMLLQKAVTFLTDKIRMKLNA